MVHWRPMVVTMEQMMPMGRGIQMVHSWWRIWKPLIYTRLCSLFVQLDVLVAGGGELGLSVPTQVLSDSFVFPPPPFVVFHVVFQLPGYLLRCKLFIIKLYCFHIWLVLSVLITVPVSFYITRRATRKRRLLDFTVYSLKRHATIVSAAPTPLVMFIQGMHIGSDRRVDYDWHTCHRYSHTDRYETAHYY